MKKSTLLFVIFVYNFIALPVFSQSVTKEIASKIEKVIVYSEGAQVTRKAKASFDAGKTELIFQGISSKIDKQSLQVKGFGNFTILSVTNQNNYLLGKKNNEVILQLEKQKKILDESKDQETALLKILTNEEVILSKNQVVSGTESVLKIQDLKETVDFHRQRLLDINKQKFEINKK